ncbi:MAG TPA: enoyl-CoA hydratase-related protein [Dehalococcoidia bacterium]|nr:enoyl-CoA hydratase-related protein [Dehalococcoidia bacterium]
MGEPAHVKVLYGRRILDNQAAAQLTTMLQAMTDDRDVRAVVLTSPQWRFEPGVDARPLVEACAAVPQPVIAAIGGNCFEEGLELALACDVRVASPDARFRCDHVGAGRTPSAGATQRLPRLAGPTLANKMILLGEEVDASEALAAGLVSEVSDDAEGRAMELAQAIAERGPLAERYAKEAVNRGMELPLEQALRYETDLTMILQTTEDRAEGVEAFIEKREPNFRGE